MAFMAVTPFFPQTHMTAAVGTTLACMVIYLMIVNVCCQFLYRLNVFCLGNRYSLKQVFGLIGLLELWTIIHCCDIANVCDRYDEPEYTAALLKNPIFEGLNETTLPAYIFGDSYDLKMMLQLADSQLIVGAGYTIIIYSAYMIERKLRRDMGDLQPSTLAAQKQLSKIMMFQACLPMPTVLLPVGLADFLPMVGISFDYLPVFIKVTISVLPLCNPIVILCTIPAFRRTIFSFVCRGKVDVAGATTSAAGLSTEKQEKTEDAQTAGMV
ncbi:Seven TM Receptor [Aphelenchoides fujianensis]|nr:Seven TM Receptor [Aphelenchoides fujianensis]